MKKYLVAAASVAAVVSAASAAHAALVTFVPPAFPDTTPYPTTFADGALSHGLSGTWAPDGFYPVDLYSAVNGYGQNGEFISFNAPVTLNSLKIGPCTFCAAPHASTYTVNLYNAASVLIGSQSITGSSTEETLTFDTPNVTKVEFDFVSNYTSPGYGDGRLVAWYVVRDVAYTLGGAVPEPAVWALMIGGFGMAGVALRRRKAAQA